ncbi:hypothetical protein G6F31_015797 [Rhizopus arrhizus]|nr:hypothetical protein G6F31_015797 [Rhizopus arrhizus]
MVVVETLPGVCQAAAGCMLDRGQARGRLGQAVASAVLLQGATLALDLQFRDEAEGEINQAEAAFAALDNEGPIGDVAAFLDPAVRPIHAQLVVAALGLENATAWQAGCGRVLGAGQQQHQRDEGSNQAARSESGHVGATAERRGPR